MKVSIVIPVYNVEKYLPCCLDSVLAQEYTDYEAILVDDGSTDTSGSICDAYARKDSRFRVLHQANGGVSHARNEGVKASGGEYVLFLDSDDCIHPQLLMTLTGLAQKYHAALVQMDVETIPEDFDDYRKKPIGDYKVFAFDTIDAFYNIDKDDQQIAHDIRLVTLVVWTKLYRRDLLEKITFPEEVRLHEDQVVAHRFIVEAGGMVFCRAAFYFYRSRPNSLITEGWTPKRLTILDCYRDRVEWARRAQGDAARVRDLVYYIYIRYLVCMFKNYWMCGRKLTGEEREDCQSQIITRFRKELRNAPQPLKAKDWLMFQTFGTAPEVFVKIYEMAGHK